MNRSTTTALTATMMLVGSSIHSSVLSAMGIRERRSSKEHKEFTEEDQENIDSAKAKQDRKAAKRLAQARKVSK